VRVDEVIYDDPLMETELCYGVANVSRPTCAIIHEHDDDFGLVEVIEPSITEKQKSPESLPSQKIEKTTILLDQ